MALRIVYWLRKPKEYESLEVPASPMSQVRAALEQLEELHLDIWSNSYEGPPSPIRVDSEGKIFILTPDRYEDLKRAGILENTLDLLGAFETPSSTGPDLVRPRPHLRIIPGKVAGEPHLEGSRLTTLAVAALHRRGYSLDDVRRLYPHEDPAALRDAIDLEEQLAAAA